ncbi:hypothetical protein NDU88_000857 [Pleurodeles waltl]|uniref:Uncharacterized protein n=1 Tax=Pleurodeles waltl TaxID=8319 RepID=A0AAV7KPE8_PLEWA|nr:hypothetical protein NDU88_000857 [Pleurodeles waltl]
MRPLRPPRGPRTSATLLTGRTPRGGEQPSLEVVLTLFYWPASPGIPVSLSGVIRDGFPPGGSGDGVSPRSGKHQRSRNLTSYAVRGSSVFSYKSVKTEFRV